MFEFACSFVDYGLVCPCGMTQSERAWPFSFRHGVLEWLLGSCEARIHLLEEVSVRLAQLMNFHLLRMSLVPLKLGW